MLKRAYDIIVLFKEYFLLALYLLIALVLFTQNTNDQVRGVRSHLLAAAGLLQDTFDFIPDYFALRRENSVLREQNILLSDQVNTLRESAIENIRLRSMFGLRERPAFNYVSALVVGTQMQALRNTVTINAGTDNGIRNGMPVVTDHGLVGRVVTTSGRYAIVQLLLHKDLRVSARVQRSRANGIIRWTGGHDLRLVNVPKTSDVNHRRRHRHVGVQQPLPRRDPGRRRLCHPRGPRRTLSGDHGATVGGLRADGRGLRCDRSAGLHAYRPRTQEQGMTSVPIIRPAVILGISLAASARADTRHPVHRDRDHRP